MQSICCFFFNENCLEAVSGFRWIWNIGKERVRFRAYVKGCFWLQGLGLYAAKDLEMHTIVIEYIGDLIRNEVANRREKFYEAQVCLLL